MAGIAAYHMFTALRLHFNQPGYDYFKYNGKTKSSSMPPHKIKTKPDFYHLQKAERKYGGRLEEYFVANFLADPTIGTVRSCSDEIYNNHRAYREAFAYRFREDIAKFDPATDFKVQEGAHPGVLRHYLGGRLNIQSLMALDAIMNLRASWDKKIEDEYVWPRVRLHMEKSAGFLKFPRAEIIRIAREEFDKRDAI